MKKLITKNLILLLLIFFSGGARLFAQPGYGISYNFSQTTGVVAPTGLTLQAVPAANQDDFGFNLAPAGMSLRFGGNTYTRFFASTNGWMTLLNAAGTPASLNTYFPNNQLSNNVSNYPILAPYWDDLSTTLISYKWAAPVLTVQWTCKINKTAPAAATNFWVTIDGSTGIVTYSYANNAAYVLGGPPSASIGIAGFCVGDYYSYDNVSSWADSTFETSTISVKPVNVNYIFTPYQFYDNCVNAYDLGPLTATCTPAQFNIYGAKTSGSAICATTDVADIWFKVVKPAGISNVTITTSSAAPACQSVTGTSIEAFTSCGGPSIGCATTSVSNPGFGELVLSRGTCNAETLYVRVTADGDVGGKFNICAKDAGASGGPLGSTCGNPNWICAIPYNFTGTTAGSIDNYDSTTSVCHTLYMNGEDYVFAYTPSASGCIQVDLTTAGDNPGVFIYNGCPNSVGTSCIVSMEFPTGTGTINSASLVAGQTYYIIVDNDTANGNLNNPFNISITSAGTAPAYDICASAVNLGTIASGTSCVPQTFTTECSTPTAVGQAGIPSCVPAHNPPYFTDGVTGDVWLRFTAGFNGSLLINTFQSAANPTANAAMAIYSGAACPSSAAAPYACDHNSGANGMPSLSIPVANGTSYYIRIWSENPENQGNFDICFQSACAPPNDLPCAAVVVPLGGTISGVNTCASSTSEPANSAQCVAGGTINTVWYQMVVPASGQVRVRTHPLTLTNTQIQGFIFASGCANAASTNTPKGCNDNGVPCSGGFSDFSEQLFTGMTPGDILYVAVDGVNSLTGSFEISAIDGNSTVFPPVNQQDCAAAQVVCSTTDVVVADPGYRNNGNICDLPSGIGCWGVGERNSVWYSFTVDPALSGGNASIAFDINSQSSTDIDFMIWDVTGLPGACQSIQSLSLLPTQCNYAAAGSQTGLAPGGTGYFSPSIAFSGTPRSYLLLLNVFNSATNAGFTLDWGTTPIASTSSTSTWTGVSDTLYTTTTNWGDCGSTPSCAVDATINASPNQPTIAAGLPAKSVRNLIINAGAKLRIKAGATLSVCGNFSNFGTLICEAGSTIQFIGTGLQTVSGSLTGANTFANLVINKSSGSVQLMNDIDVNENFTTTNSTSVFNINGKYMKVKGNFTNANGAITFAGIANSTVEFNGITHQNFVNNSGSIALNKVVMNKPSGKLYLLGVNSTMNIDSTLKLTSGNIVTRSLPTLEVNMKYYLPAAVIGPLSAASYIDGKLRRKISQGVFTSPIIPASYDFPLGDSLTPGGYELANITFNTPALITDVLGTFSPWPSGAPAAGPVASECIIATYSNKPIFDNGYWTFARTGVNVTGMYRVSLFNTGFTNNTGLGWTVAKADILANPALTTSWSLTGNCVVTSTANNTQRSDINPPPGADSLCFNHHYATAQTEMTLPIELLYFTAEPKGEDVICRWETASEINNEYFDVERSNDGKEFEAIGRIPGYGNGTTTEPRKYSLVDQERCESIRYYRLKQVDIDGEYSYSDPVAVNCRKIDGIELFPNPAQSIINYKFYSPQDSELLLEIHDVSGRIIRSEKISVVKGINQNNLSIEDVAEGAYTLRISGVKENIMLQKQFFKN